MAHRSARLADVPFLGFGHAQACSRGGTRGEHRIAPLPSRRGAETHPFDGIASPRCTAGRSSPRCSHAATRSEEHTSELQSLMRISYAVFCLKKKTKQHTKPQALHIHNK